MCFLNFTDLCCSMAHEGRRKAAIVVLDSVRSSNQVWKDYSVRGCGSFQLTKQNFPPSDWVTSLSVRAETWRPPFCRILLLVRPPRLTDNTVAQELQALIFRSPSPLCSTAIQVSYWKVKQFPRGFAWRPKWFDAVSWLYPFGNVLAWYFMSNALVDVCGSGYSAKTNLRTANLG